MPSFIALCVLLLIGHILRSRGSAAAVDVPAVLRDRWAGGALLVLQIVPRLAGWLPEDWDGIAVVGYIVQGLRWFSNTVTEMQPTWTAGWGALPGRADQRRLRVPVSGRDDSGHQDGLAAGGARSWRMGRSSHGGSTSSAWGW